MSLIKTLEGHVAPVRSVAFSRNGAFIVSCTGSIYSIFANKIKVWSVDTGECVRTFIGHPAIISSVSFSPNGAYIVSGSNDTTVKVWSVVSGLEMSSFDHSSYVSSVEFSPDGASIVSGSYDNTVKIWSVESGECVRTMETDSEINSVSFSPDGVYIASGSRGRMVEVWSVESGECVMTFAGHLDQVNSVSFDPVEPYGLWIASGSDDCTVKVWDVQDGGCATTFESDSEIDSVSFDPGDRRYIVSGERDRTVKVWSLETNECLRTLAGHSAAVTSVSFSQDGASIVSGSMDATVKIWSTDPLPALPYDLGQTIQYAEFNVDAPSPLIKLIYDDLEQDNTDISCDFMAGAKEYPLMLNCGHIFCLEEVRDLRRRNDSRCPYCRSQITHVHVMTAAEIKTREMSSVNKDIEDLERCKGYTTRTPEEKRCKGYTKKLKDKKEEKARKEAERIRRKQIPRLKL